MAKITKEDYLKTIFQFKNLINTEFGHGKQHALSLTELLIMQGIAQQQSSVAIASDLHITKAAVSQCTTGLDRKGLITRTTDPQNRRNLSLTLTETGRTQLAQTNHEFDAAFATFVQDMGVTDLEQLLSLMQKMTTIIGK
ncbi:MarR family winged helix-turn-helix transcriptional regulator [Lacticaseibacillus songhuajiangensis]|jgi:DNA-binding MarR family transcriptional regulator|uniref:MarR family winged helix-turn-helix transcriptional regulator n=1 Tax=Lacticaseibacillus songhuajiangensis TaxID=1296539 RepID=UPI000F77A63E|nr:MarR family transcriptional regulator [Lacticaseibacillus songhuajiangensis]